MIKSEYDLKRLRCKTRVFIHALEDAGLFNNHNRLRREIDDPESALSLEYKELLEMLAEEERQLEEEEKRQREREEGRL